MMKRIVLSIFMALMAAGMVTLVNAQDLGEIYFATGEYEMAKKELEKQLSENPAQANYYLGEIEYAKGEMAKAKAHYEKGVAASPEYALNYVGLGSILLKTDAKAAEAEFSKAIAKNKKSIDVTIAIARAYYVNGKTAELDKKMIEAEKIGKKSPIYYTFKGDMLGAAEKIGEAAGQYETAKSFDPNYAVPYVKLAQIYLTNPNPDIPSEELNELLKIRPDYIMAYKYLGDVNYRSGRYKNAIEAYQKLFTQPDHATIEDLTRYAASLYFSEQFKEASELIQEGVQKAPNNFVLNRLLMYSSIDTKDYANGLSRAEKFFSLDKGDNKYIPRDYTTYANLLIENDRLEDALPLYDKAVEMDSTQIVLYLEIAEKMTALREYSRAGEYYEKYIEKDTVNAQALDYFQMGRSYYVAATQIAKDKEDPQVAQRMNEYLQKADKAFGVVDERTPDKPLGSIFRARTNALIDPDASQGLARPYYEKVAKLIVAEQEKTDANLKDLLEAYRYLSYYHYVQFDENKNNEDKDASIKYCEEMLLIDPTNAVALQLIGALKQ